jgi:hydroxyacylglutathione hydrolase
MHVAVLPALGDNYVYLLVEGREGAVVDPAEAGPALSAARTLGADITLALITHHHYDHTAGCAALKNGTGCTIVGPTGGSPVDRTVGEGDTVRLGGSDLHVLAVPGHTRNHVAYYAPGERCVWTGDTLFVSGCGRIIGGTAEQMWESLKKIRALPDDTRVYCGHDYTEDNLEFALHVDPENRDVQAQLNEVRDRARKSQPTVPSTLAVEKRTNPFLRADADPMAEALGMAGAPPVAVFAELRRRKDRW